VAEYAHRVIYLRDGMVYFGDYNKKVIFMIIKNN